jgi:oligopeptide/dipeptide ABC transporter ATP-binding protein
VSAPAEARSGAPLLSIDDLAVSFETDGGVVQALGGVSFDVPAGAAIALVGESGSGKSVTAQTILRILPETGARIERGRVLFEGADLLALPEKAMRAVRGGRIGIVFQEPLTSLDPVYTVGAQIAEAVRLHRPVSRREARARVIELLRSVGFPTPEERAGAYPHELSGGMRQRVMIAMALACDPALLVADEPTSALDATVAAQILELLDRLRRERGMSLLFISHDLDAVGHLCEGVVVLYAGQVVEVGPSASVLASPRHPYTRALLRSVPPRAGAGRQGKAKRLPTIEGAPPDLRSPPSGCRFRARCAEAFARCAEPPPLYELGPGARSRCFLADPARAEEVGT